MCIDNGSNWRQCDLHIHTPYSRETLYGNKDEEATWDAFVADIEQSYTAGAILGINDYNSFEGYFKLKTSYPQLSQKYLLLPVIELRTDDYVGKNANQKINLHIIFSNDIAEKDLRGILSTPLTLEKKKIQDIQNFASEPISMTKLVSFLEENSNYYKNKYLLMLGKNEVNEIDNNIKGSYLANIHFLCNAAPLLEQACKAQKDTQQFYASNDIKYLHCSDAHLFSSNMTEKTRKIGHCYTWIKGKPLFETIRQAFFSYDSRVAISEEKPTQAVNVIEKIHFALPIGTKIGNNACCFAGEDISLSFNPGLNCLIGGRGVGKSLLLQLCCKYNQGLLPKNDKNIVNKINPKEWADSVTIDGIEFEYFGQGNVEEFYQDKDRFKELVSQRLKKFWETESIISQDQHNQFIPMSTQINQKRQSLEEYIQVINKELEILNQKNLNDRKIFSIDKEIQAHTKILSVFQDNKYKEIQKNISDLSGKVSFIEDTKSMYSDFVKKLQESIVNMKEINILNKEDVSFYATKYNSLLKQINTLVCEDKSEKFLLWINKENTLISELENKKQIMREYLLNRGVSNSNIHDALNSQKEIDSLCFRKKQLFEENNRPEKDFAQMQSEIIKRDTEYKTALTNVLAETKKILHNKGNDEINKLTFVLEYDTHKMFSDLCAFVKKNMNIDPSDFEALLHRRTALQNSQPLLSSMLETIARENTDLRSSGKVLSFFNNLRNKKIYDLYYLTVKYNHVHYQNFTIQYENKNLDELSFGQRATAVIITLLLFASKPLLIDEPETHLDQKFIATKLVNVIKHVKKDKQLIFATHNANLVINGDAEQIFILESNANNLTTISPMSIEDIGDEKQKEKLLMLEGSREAFKLREDKYSI